MILGFSHNDWLAPKLTQRKGNTLVVSANEGHPVRAGTRSLKCDLTYTAPDPDPVSMIMPAIAFSETLADEYAEAFEFNSSYWIGCSVYLPPDWEFDNWNTGGECVLEFQGVPDPEETKRPFSLIFSIWNDHWVIETTWDARETSPPGVGYEGRAVLYQQPLGASIGAWTDWVINVRFAWDADGLTRIWRQGALIVDREGPNCANDDIGPHLFAGLYKWGWRDGPTDVSSRVIYIDELRIANTDSGYGAVAPGGRF